MQEQYETGRVVLNYLNFKVVTKFIHCFLIPLTTDPLCSALLSTIWYELHAREWPYKSQPAEAIIWQIGSGMKPNLAQTGMGKEISVSFL